MPRHATTAGPEAIANVSNLLANEPVDHHPVALVANGGGVGHRRANTDHADRIRTLIERGVDVYSCRNAMSAQGLTSDDLVGGVETVPSGVGGVADLEADGFLYIKIP
jgi:intracellular sulfur oxidation DsrE/DsrF family protein